ncbi:response regulator [Dongshaea marina]|uniref:response regulator n=1 Tax=Dongshaea marina TaxID=2047966 RepID=UPI000D3E7AA6|nr:response regulator [Dongshaea marina]
MDDDILIIEDDQTPEQETKLGWKVLIVDDEPEVHRITKITLTQFQFDGKPIEFLHAYSGAEAKAMLQQHKDIALLLLDVVMETDDAGLDVANYTRNELHNQMVRIVLRTGQPGQAPEDDVVENYDINDYKDKTELTSQKLRTLIRASLRSYRDIVTLEHNKQGLEKVIEASRGIFEQQALRSFVEGALEQLGALLNFDETTLYSSKRNSAYEIKDEAPLPIFPESEEAETPEIVLRAMENRQNLFEEHNVVLFCKNARHNLLFHLEGEGAHELNEVDTYLLNLFTENIVVALENIRLNELIVDNQREIIYRIGEIVETRSKESGLHVKRVALYSELLAQLMGQSEKQCEMIKQASPLHDIGKVGIPDAVLNKPGKLTPEEWEIMKTHAQLGNDMLCGSDIELFRMGASIALTHHEKMDGTGYPNGLSGDQIPLEGRITALADVFDALGSDRCYKKAWPLDKILGLIKEEKGRQFDPTLVDLMLDNLDQFLEIRDTYKDEYLGDD